MNIWAFPLSIVEKTPSFARLTHGNSLLNYFQLECMYSDGYGRSQARNLKMLIKVYLQSGIFLHVYRTSSGVDGYEYDIDN